MSDYVTLDSSTFATLVGKESRDVYLFRVSEAWLDVMRDDEWHGPVEWHITRNEGAIVELEMRTVPESRGRDPEDSTPHKETERSSDGR
jgi:hypothetical protein